MLRQRLMTRVSGADCHFPTAILSSRGALWKEDAMGEWPI